ncbi:MAG TPA: hypothetical protein VJX92_07090 [Methylomirabilota bacterium]|nr:hypothetical protein [Methylomirabilota bacterium]
MTLLLAALLATGMAPAASAGDLLPAIGARVRIQAEVLGPGWHDGMFTQTRVPAACYEVLIFKPRFSRTAAMEWAATVFIEHVTALEVDAGPRQPMQDWVGMPSTGPSVDRWRPVPLEGLRDADVRCRSH